MHSAVRVQTCTFTKNCRTKRETDGREIYVGKRIKEIQKPAKLGHQKFTVKSVVEEFVQHTRFQVNLECKEQHVPSRGEQNNTGHICIVMCDNTKLKRRNVRVAVGSA